MAHAPLALLMQPVLALDIETANYSWEVGGWDKTHLFEPTIVATWDGDSAHLFSKTALDVEGAICHPLHPRDLGEHLLKHTEAGGVIVGHNIAGFDLPVLRDALDCYEAGALLGKQHACIRDTSRLFRSAAKHSATLEEICKHTLGTGKSGMTSIEAPEAWREGRHSEVAKYCIADARLAYDLYAHGRSDGFVKARSRDTGAVIEIEVTW